jgi:hypothetical protein
MKVAVIGSRTLFVKLEYFLEGEITEIISGGAKGVDTCARNFAIKNNIKLTEIFPDYNTYGKVAPLKRNDIIIEKSDIVYAFWDRQSHGTKYVIEKCKKEKHPIRVFVLNT